MRKCLQLAEKGKPFVGLNPMVGSVLVKGDGIVAEGFHAGFGLAHAERALIEKLPGDFSYADCTLIVNLEPCSHHGKTPPCADLIIEKGIKKVVVGTLDPNPLVAGKGVAKLRAAGVSVEVGVLHEECMQLNRKFFVNITENRSYCIAKWASTADGFMASSPGMERLMISGEDAQNHLHWLRGYVDAILVGVGTWEVDKPRLDCRMVDPDIEISDSFNPVRVVLDPNLRGNYDADRVDIVFSPLLVLNTLKDGEEVTPRGNKLHYVKIPNFWVWDELLQILFKHKISQVLVEGGKQTLEGLLLSGCADEIMEYRNTALRAGGGVVSPDFPNGWQFQQWLGKDLLRIHRRNLEILEEGDAV